MMRAYIEAVAVFSSAFLTWQQAREMLKIRASLTPEREIVLPKPQKIPARELRRLTSLAKMNLAVVEAAFQTTDLNPQDCASIFAMATGGDTEIIHKNCLSLRQQPPSISPTLFSHSLLNSTAGVWCMHSGSMHRSMSLTAADDTVAMGLLEAMLLLTMDKVDVVLSIADNKIDNVLRHGYPVDYPFAFALLMTTAKTERSTAELQVQVQDSALPVSNPYIEQSEIYQDNPAAKILLLLDAVANLSNTPLVIGLPYQDEHFLKVDIIPC